MSRGEMTPNKGNSFHDKLKNAWKPIHLGPTKREFNLSTFMSDCPKQWMGRTNRKLQMNCLSFLKPVQFKTSRKLLICLEDKSMNIRWFSNEKPNIVNMYPVDLGNTRMSTHYAQNSPQTLIMSRLSFWSRACQPRVCHIHSTWNL